MPLNVGALFRGLLPRSKLSLEQAIQIRQTEGVGGTVVIQIPPRGDMPCEVFVTTGRGQLVHDLWNQDWAKE